MSAELVTVRVCFGTPDDDETYQREDRFRSHQIAFDPHQDSLIAVQWELRTAPAYGDEAECEHPFTAQLSMVRHRETKEDQDRFFRAACRKRPPYPAFRDSRAVFSHLDLWLGPWDFNECRAGSPLAHPYIAQGYLCARGLMPVLEGSGERPFMLTATRMSEPPFDVDERCEYLSDGSVRRR